jgi:hypothetical protein
VGQAENEQEHTGCCDGHKLCSHQKPPGSAGLQG